MKIQNVFIGVKISADLKKRAKSAARKKKVPLSVFVRDCVVMGVSQSEGVYTR